MRVFANTIRLLSGIVLFAGVLCAGDVPLLKEPVKPGVERGAWSLEAWGNSGSADKYVIGDHKLLKLIYTGGEKDKSAFKHITCFGVAHNAKLVMHVYAPEDNPPQVGLALSTTPAYIWHESKPVDLKKGWNKVEISAANRDWKTATSEWKFTTAIEPRDDVRAIDIVIYNGNKTGVLYVLGLQYDPDARGEKIAALASKMRSEEPDARAEAEKELVAIGRPAMEALFQLADDERPEVLLRAASALRQIEAIKEEPPPDPKIRAELEKQREEQSFDESRRRAEYTLRGLDNERIKLLGLLKDAHTELLQGREELKMLKFVDEEKRKSYTQTLDKMDAALKELGPLMLPKK